MISKFQVPQLFLGLFLRKLDVQDYRKLADSLPWRLPEFDGQPRIAQNVPENANADQPRAAFQSQDGRKVLEIAPAKIQLRMMPGEVVDTGQQQKGLKPLGVSESYNEFIPLADKVYKVFNEHYGAVANRIGVMSEMFAHLGASANQRMQNTLLANKTIFGDRLTELNVQALSKPTLNDRVVNRWIRVRPLRSNDNRQADLAMAVQVDINTPADDSYDLEVGDVEKFITAVKEHIETKVPVMHEEAFFDGAAGPQEANVEPISPQDQ